MNHFDLNDLRKQIDTMQKMGSTRELTAKMPGTGSMQLENIGGMDVDEEVRLIKGMIDSMTSSERRDPGLIDNSRRPRISAGSGRAPADVASLIKQFDAMAAVVRQMSKLRKFRW
jgi:signal recognition particle subunit SRP54